MLRARRNVVVTRSDPTDSHRRLQVIVGCMGEWLPSECLPAPETTMSSPAELEEKFWKALNSDMTMMLGIPGVDGGHLRPMTAQLDEGQPGPMWFFTSTDNALVRALARDSHAVASFVAKGHDLFASLQGTL